MLGASEMTSQRNVVSYKDVREGFITTLLASRIPLYSHLVHSISATGVVCVPQLAKSKKVAESVYDLTERRSFMSGKS